MKHRICAFLAALCCLSGADGRAAQVIDNAALTDEKDGTNWAAYGRTFSETHYSPLKQIGIGTVKRLGLAWSFDLDVTNSITAPLAVNGVVYLSAGHGTIYAVDAKSGRQLWRYDAKATELAHQKMRVAWGIRGLAFWKNRLYTGTTDGRLIALNAADGTLAWSVLTVDPNDSATITGAPRAFNGKIIIGFSGEDFAPLRGYVTAYDAETGKQAWRFYLVPGQPGSHDGAVSDAVMEKAAKTWNGEWWKQGGGGGAWNAMTYDPQFNRVYIGTGNGHPSNPRIRSPGGGDNLFVASIVALDADTGRYVWHYQVTPGDSWDYDATNDMTLTTLRIDGKPHQVILHASKNGFTYVLDRENGHLISAEKLGTVTWADHVDLKTGKPVLTPGALYEKPIVIWPSFQSVHHWPPQSYNPETGYLYVPTLEMPAEFSDTGGKLGDPHHPSGINEHTGVVVGDDDAPPDVGRSVLKAWDPVAKRVVWQVETAGISNGGTLATAGNLVFEGLADGYLHAYSARDGKDLWSFFAGVAVTGVPITYSVDGRQYVTITAGPLGGSTAAFGAVAARWGWDPRVHPRRLLTFALDANAKLPPTPPRRPAVPLAAPDFQLNATKAQAGARLYRPCGLCHGSGVIAGGIAPDLRASPVPLSTEAFTHIVRDGSLEVRGMPRFAELNDEQLDDLRHYFRQKARNDLAAQRVRDAITQTR